MPNPKIAIPIRQLEEILADIKDTASKPRTVAGYAKVIQFIFPAAAQMIANGYDLEEVIQYFIKRDIHGFDPDEFRKAYLAHAARSTTKKAPAVSTPPSRAAAPAEKPAAQKTGADKPNALRSVDGMTKNLATAV